MRIWPRDSRRTVAAALLAAVLPLAPAEASLAEEWYLFRARANRKIKNYKAAIEGYQKAIEKNPKSREALRGLGEAYEANGQTDEAIGAWDRYLEAYSDDPEIAFKQAQVLSWSRYRYRRKDAIRYYRMGLAARDDFAMRRALARLLARDKATLEEALAEHRRLLEQRPDDEGLRAQYRKLLAWDPRHLDEAIREQERVAQARPGDREASRQLARLYAQHKPRLGDAIDLYGKLVAASPADRKLRLEYGRVLAKDPARREQAREQLEKGMGASPDFATRKLFASLLAADEDSRDEAIEHHRKLLAEKPDDVEVRIGLAKLLAARKETSREAIRELERAARQRPQSAEIQEGLARAWAWQGEEDRALDHGRRAQDMKSDAPDIEELGERLEQGREPRLGGGISLLVQPAGDHGLFGLRLPLQGRADLGAYITLSAEGGFEHYRGPSGASASGAFFGFSGEGRFSRDTRLRLGLGAQTVRPGAAALHALAGFDFTIGSTSLRPRFERQPRSDSFRALAGGGETPGGAVTANTGSLAFERRSSSWTTVLAPFVSVLTSEAADANLHLGVDGGVELALVDSPPWRFAAGVDGQVSHYGRDELPITRGGYFSPDVYAAATPRVSLRFEPARGRYFEAAAGPSLQFQLFHGGSGSLVPGGQARLRAVFAVERKLEADLRASAVRVGDVYTRIDLAGSLLYVF